MYMICYLGWIKKAQEKKPYFLCCCLFVLTFDYHQIREENAENTTIVIIFSSLCNSIPSKFSLQSFFFTHFPYDFVL